MNAEVKPLTAVIVISLAIGFILSWFLINEQMQMTPAPTVIAQTPDEQLSIVVGNKLFIKGAYVERVIDLGEMDVGSPLIGDLRWLDSEHILVRKGNSHIPFLEMFMLGEKDPGRRLQNIIEKVQVCNVTTSECAVLNDSLGEMKFDFTIAVSEDNVIALGEMGSGKIRLLSDEGDQLSVWDEGLSHPEKIYWDKDRLFVANTDKKFINELIIKDKRIVRMDKLADMRDVAELKKNLYPYDIGKDSLSWVVLARNKNFTEQGLYRFSEDWQFIEEIDMPENVEPVSVIVWRDALVLMDSPNRKLFKKDADGNWEKFEWPALDVELSIHRDRYEEVFTWLIFLCVAIIASFLLGIYKGLKEIFAIIPKVPEASLEEKSIHLSDPRIKWIEVDTKVKRMVWILGFLSVTSIGLVVFMLLEFENLDLETAVIFMSLPVMSGAMTYWYRGLSLQRLGIIEGEFVVVSKGKDHIVAAKPERVYYNHQALIIDRTSVLFGNGNLAFFPQKQLVDKIFPTLKDKGHELTSTLQQAMVIRNVRPVTWVMIFGLSLGFTLLYVWIEFGWFF